MAKRKAKVARKSRSARIAARIYVGRSEGRAGFQACVVIGGPGKSKSDDPIGERCGTGSNPRKAIANAMRGAAKLLDKRSGAFEGLK